MKLKFVILKQGPRSKRLKSRSELARMSLKRRKEYAHKVITIILSGGHDRRRPCCVCGHFIDQVFLRNHAHHEDYMRPLWVAFLCKKHHHERHSELQHMELIAETNEFLSNHRSELKRGPRLNSK